MGDKDRSDKVDKVETIEVRKPADERLTDLFNERMNSDAWFRTTLRLELKASELYWLVNLAQEGLDARRKAWSEKPGGLAMDERLSLASFAGDLNAVVDAAKEAKVLKPKKLKRSKR